FLTVKNNDKLNTMTIGWGTIGYIWGKPIFMVMVRKSRYTYEIIEKAEDFTVSLPENGKMKNELGFCGTKSGRDFNKFKECQLTAVPSQKVKTPIIDECTLHFECDIIYKLDMDNVNNFDIINDKWYPDDNYHTLYFGEIVDSYLI
ncbi:MAG: flavin reductase family protein, partial [Halanaerobiales bacterium]